MKSCFVWSKFEHLTSDHQQTRSSISAFSHCANHVQQRLRIRVVRIIDYRKPSSEIENLTAHLRRSNSLQCRCNFTCAHIKRCTYRRRCQSITQVMTTTHR